MENICDDDHQIGILPRDVLIHQILVLLPVISLLRFKSVCKSWCALIQSSFFIHLHLNTTTTTSNNNFGTFIFQTSKGYVIGNTRGSEAFMLSAGASGSGSGEEEEELKLEDLRFPSCYNVTRGVNDYIFMVGSCNGLICIHDTKERDVSLWNPATKQFRLLPKSLTTLEAGVPDGQLEQDFVAFGYDVKTKDYKVVQISQFRPYMTAINRRWLSVNEYILRVQVYSSSTDSWRLLEGINSLPGPALPIREMGLNHGVYLNGSYYFLGWYRSGFEITMTRDTTILSFDFTKEIFTTIQLPLPHDYHPRMISTYLGEKLAVFAHIVDEEDRSDFETYEIWVLNEHGGVKEEEEEESWTKLHVLYSDGKPRGMSNNGEFAFIGNGSCSEINGVFVYGDKLRLFNLVTQEIKKEFPTPHEVVRAYVYKQSLVSIVGNDTTTNRVIGAEM